MHIPVMLHETIDALLPKVGGVYVDCTVNRASHAAHLASKIGAEGTLILIDLNERALVDAKVRLEAIPDHPRYIFAQSNYRFIQDILQANNIRTVDGVMADLGLSSEELDDEHRGFSFRFDEPLMMTFQVTPLEGDTTAYDIVNTWSEETIADVLYYFSDETYARRIAKVICDSRERATIATTFDLVRLIESAVPASYRHKKTHCATKTFQALRMAVNDELGGIADLINALPHILTPDGRASIITFHSTEDRHVKKLVRALPEELHFVQAKAIVPSESELKANPRARSAQLRVIEKYHADA